MSVKLTIETERPTNDHKHNGTGHFYAVLEIDAVSVVSLVKERYLFDNPAGQGSTHPLEECSFSPKKHWCSESMNLTS